MIAEVLQAGNLYSAAQQVVLNKGASGGYFGVMVPGVSVKWCHFERSYNYS